MVQSISFKNLNIHANLKREILELQQVHYKHTTPKHVGVYHNPEREIMDSSISPCECKGLLLVKTDIELLPLWLYGTSKN